MRVCAFLLSLLLATTASAGGYLSPMQLGRMRAAAAMVAASAPYYNVLDYGALCNANYSSGGGNDDTAEIQAAIDDAVDDSGAGMVVIPSGHVCRITSTLTVTHGVHIIGYGGHDSSGTGPPIIVWDGAADGTMVSVLIEASNTTNVRFQNLAFNAGTLISNKPGVGIHFEGSDGPSPVDTGTTIQDCWFYGQTGNAIEFADGATNFYLIGGRMDEIGGYGIEVTGGSFNAQIMGSFTWAATGPKGFMHLDGSGGSRSYVQIDTLHTEVNDPDETYASGTKPFDKAGIIRLSVDTTTNYLQHRLMIHNWFHSKTSGANSHSMVQVTAASGTALAGLEHVSFILDQGDGVNQGTDDDAATDEIRLIGGLVPTSVRPSYRSQRVAQVNIGLGTDFSQETLNSQTYARHGAILVRGLAIQPETVADLYSWFQAGALAYVTDSNSTTLGATVAGGGANKVVVLWNGTNWVIIAVAN